MSDAQIIGYIIVGLSAIVGLFMAIYKPLSENTKTMVSLSEQMKQLTNEIAKQNKEIEKQEKEFDAYKDHMRESQKRQWNAIDEHTQAINEVNHKLENYKLEHREREE